MKVAIVGAGGFVGTRLVERWAALGPHEPVPVVRHPASLARLARFPLAWRRADARDERGLTAALSGCDAVVQCMVAEGDDIVAAVAPLWRAACAAGVRRVVYLSSAAVHGIDPEPGTDERTAMPEGQGVPYNDARVSAELRLLDLARGRGPGVVLLRPSVVYGPRSRWITDVAEALLAARAGWVNEGRGLCNAIHVDNLVHAIECALTAESGACGAPYLLRDPGRCTWAEFLVPIAHSLGFGPEAFRSVAPLSPAVLISRPSLVERVRKMVLRARLNERVPGRLKAVVKGAAQGLSPRQGGGASRLPRKDSGPRLPAEWNLLMQCRWDIPTAAAQRALGYAPRLSTPEGLARSVAWLRWAGYPVQQRSDSAGRAP